MVYANDCFQDKQTRNVIITNDEWMDGWTDGRWMMVGGMEGFFLCFFFRCAATKLLHVILPVWFLVQNLFTLVITFFYYYGLFFLSILAAMMVWVVVLVLMRGVCV